MQVVSPSASDAACEWMRILVAAASFLGTSSNHERKPAALFQALDIHLKGMLYVVSSPIVHVLSIRKLFGRVCGHYTQ